MKLLITILRDSDYENISQALISNGFRVTHIASTGGFLRRGSSTLMIGVEDEKLDDAINVLKTNIPPTSDINMKHATVFVLNVESFKQI